MHQDHLFFDRLEDAIAVVVEQCGGRKAFASAMFPHKPPRDAHNLLDAMLNPERREKFSPDQVVYIARRGREANCHAVMRHLCHEAGYRDPVPVDPADQAAELQQKFVDAVASLQQIQTQLERSQALRRVA